MLKTLSDLRRRQAPAPATEKPAAPKDDDERKNAALARVRAGEKRGAVCAALGVSPATLSRWCVGAGLRDPKNRGRKRVDRTDLRTKFALLRPAMSLREIGKKFGCSGARVCQILSESAPAQPVG